MVILGVARENIDRLTDGKPIRVTPESHPGYPTDAPHIVIVFGETLREITKMLTPFMDSNTKIVDHTAPRGSVQ